MATVAHHFLAGRVRALVHDFEWVGHTIHEFLVTEPLIDGEQDEASIAGGADEL